MTERHIPFSGEMVRSLLAGTKTQTRRVIKPSWIRCLDLDDEDDRASALAQCPCGAPGDRLWVREAWRLPSDLDAFSGAEVGAKSIEAGYRRPWAPVQYEADGRRTGEWVEWLPMSADGGPPQPGRYRHARFMPRWASRITLDVLSVRVERLREITEEDARAEGCTGHDPEPRDEGGTVYAWGGRSSAPDPRAHFAHLWDSINAARPGCSWDANPWVWVVTFGPAEVRS